MRRRPIWTALALGLCLAAAGAAGEQLVVVEAAGSDLEPGTVVDAAEPIRLAGGASVQLMSASGEIIALSGPFEGPPTDGKAGGAAADTGLVAAVSGLLRPDETSAVPGAFRSGAAGGEPPPEIWLIDPETGGPHCLPAAAPAALWRAEGAEEAVLEILGDDGDAMLFWEADETVADWPEGLPLVDGALYELNWEESLESAEITLRLLPAGTPPDASGLAALIDHGCRRQAVALLGQLASAAAEGS